jgi:hypothetical protein
VLIDSAAKVIQIQAHLQVPRASRVVPRHLHLVAYLLGIRAQAERVRQHRQTKTTHPERILRAILVTAIIHECRCLVNIQYAVHTCCHGGTARRVIFSFREYVLFRQTEVDLEVVEPSVVTIAFRRVTDSVRMLRNAVHRAESCRPSGLHASTNPNSHLGGLEPGQICNRIARGPQKLPE